jgi:hypothetical protein
VNGTRRGECTLELDLRSMAARQRKWISATSIQHVDFNGAADSVTANCRLFIFVILQAID